MFFEISFEIIACDCFCFITYELRSNIRDSGFKFTKSYRSTVNDQLFLFFVSDFVFVSGFAFSFTNANITSSVLFWLSNVVCSYFPFFSLASISSDFHLLTKIFNRKSTSLLIKRILTSFFYRVFA